MENKIKQFGWKRNLEYAKTKTILQLKGINEYKLNFYYGLLFSIIFSLTNLFFLFLINNNFSILINWGRQEYLFFVIFGGFYATLVGGFCWGSNLRMFLVNGNFNTLLTRPINIFLQYFTTSTILFVSFPAIVYFFLTLYLVFFILDSYSLERLIITFIFGFFGSLLYLVMFRFFDSIAFFMKNNSFLHQLYLDPQNLFMNFPSVMFEKSKFKYFILIFGNTYFASYSTQFFFGHIGYGKLFSLIAILISLNLLIVCSTWLIWHYGLKKYEAFG